MRRFATFGTGGKQYQYALAMFNDLTTAVKKEAA
jgi:hypothetical protein